MSIKNNYNCSMDELYTGLHILKANLLEELLKFQEHKPKYTAAFADGFGLAINAADAIPDETQRNADNEVRRIMLKLRLKAEPDALEPGEGEKYLGKLRTYIKAAYPIKDVQRVRLSEAGFDDYDKVMNYNWDKVRQVMQKGKEFIDAKQPELLANLNMPPTFEAEFDAVADGIIADLDLYLTTKDNIFEITQSKLVANNLINGTGQEICGDGQEIFRRNPAKRVKFVWSSIMESVTPPGAAGLRGTVKAAGSNVPQVGAVIEMQKEGGLLISFVTDNNGMYYSGNLAVGVYTFKLTKEGFGTIETSIEIKTGTTSYKHWLLAAGGGTVIVREGLNLGIGLIANVDTSGIEGNEDDITVKLEALGTQVEYFASDSPTGEATGGKVTVNMGVPVELKLNVFKALIGVGGANEYLNVKNSGPVMGGWKVTFTLP